LRDEVATSPADCRVSAIACATPLTASESAAVPCAACCVLRLISCVAASCSSIAAAIEMV
jgi:hypothetical protein